MYIYTALLISITLLLSNCSDGTSEDELSSEQAIMEYPLHRDVTTTLFWIGEEANSSTNANISNLASAWDENWTTHYGGVDALSNRVDYKPTAFRPKENPFYFALPFNDFDANGSRKESLEEYIPWAKYHDLKDANSICKNRWIKITKGSQTVYAQWEDVGPFIEDDKEYVFGKATAANEINENAALDVSPAVHEYLGLNGLEKTSWQFVDFVDVPDGPWLETITDSNMDLSWYRPNYKTSWQWQLSGEINTAYDVTLYDIDLFTTTKEQIKSLQERGKKVICYFSAGSYEAWREDADDFTAALKGKKMDGWDELWLDISNENLRPIMSRRIALAKEKGCDGVEPDNVDGYTNDTGFNLSYAQQLQYNIFLAKEAHSLGLSIGLKNDLFQIDDLIKYFDFALNEQCHKYNECSMLSTFTRANRAVFNAEYSENYIVDRDSFCQTSRIEKLQTLLLPLELDDSFRYSCSE